METKEYTTVDKSAWPRGEWDNEPDKVQWQDEATGLPCLAVRNRRYGNWCGYVGVAAGHPAFERDYNDVNVEVHGGLTFAEFCQPTEDESVGICHTPGDGEPDHVWWLGFDCLHSGDYAPNFGGFARGWHDSYKNLNYVRGECRSLARQLASYPTAPGVLTPTTE